MVPALTPIYPPKLHRGDTVRVIAPSQSRGVVMEHDHSGLIGARFHDLGLGLTFGDHVDERDDFDSAPIGSRVADLHAAFADAGVHGILTVIGGFFRTRPHVTAPTTRRRRHTRSYHRPIPTGERHEPQSPRADPPPSRATHRTASYGQRRLWTYQPARHTACRRPSRSRDR